MTKEGCRGSSGRSLGESTLTPINDPFYPSGSTVIRKTGRAVTVFFCYILHYENVICKFLSMKLVMRNYLRT